MGVKIKPKEKKKKAGEEERLKNTVELPETGYGLHTPGDSPYEASTPNVPPKGTRYDLALDASVAPAQYEEEPETRSDLIRLQNTKAKVKRPL